MARSSATVEQHNVPFKEFPCIATDMVESLTSAIGNSDSFRDQYLLENILSKYEGTGGSSPETRAQRARDSMRNDEALNVLTNRRLMSGKTHRFPWFTSEALFATTQRIIMKTLGDFSYDIYAAGEFSSGAGVHYKSGSSSVYKKYRGRVSCTPDARSRVIACIKSTPLWHAQMIDRWGPETHHWVRVVKGNIGFTAPKDGETDRFCCKEATGNMYLQKALGNRIRKKLKSVGIDLNNQLNNRRAAYQASITQSDATLDLKSASNSLTVALVYRCMPDDWFDELYAIRSSYCAVSPPTTANEKQQWHRMEMISSMGNGYTFELESLIFWALGEAVRKLSGCPGRTLVFGDDIIVPIGITHRVIAVLNYVGFRINMKKSFWKGDFRESCGGHYKNGVDVTPIYIRKYINDTSRVLWFLNRLRSWGDIGGIVDDRLWSLYRRVQRSHVDPRLWGGKRLASATSLATPHPRRQRLAYPTARERTSGRAGLLRAFQYKSTDVDYGYVAIGSDGTYLCNETREDTDQVVRCLRGLRSYYGSSAPKILYEIGKPVGVTGDRMLVFETEATSLRPTGLRPNEEHDNEDVPYFCAELIVSF